MPRTKALADEEVLQVALRLVQARGPEGLTFQSLAKACGLSPATLVQRFGSKAELMRATLGHAWDHLDRQTWQLAAEAPRTPEGAVQILVGLSGYGDIDDYADGLLLLREDFRDPALRARGAAWKRALCQALDACFADVPEAPEGVGLLLASHWQGSLVWWGFEPKGRVEAFVEETLERLVAALTRRP